jgi:hypothetical protein
MQNEIQLATQRGEIEKGKLHAEAEVKKALMDHEFELNMKMKEMELKMLQSREQAKETNKKRISDNQIKSNEKIQDRKLKGFESSGNDVIGSGLGLEAFGPR